MIAGEFPGLFTFAELAAMGYRDVMFWAAEAERKMIVRRMEQCNAAMLPYQTADTIRETVAAFSNRLAEMDHDESEIERVERENAELIKAARKRRDQRRGRGRSKKAAKPAFLHVKTAIPGMARIAKRKPKV